MVNNASVTQHIRRNSSQLISGGVVTGLFRIGNVTCVILLNILVTKMLQQDQAGIYFTLWGTVVFVALFGQLGLRQATVKWVADALEKSDDARLRAAISTSTQIANLSFGIICIISTGIYLLLRTIGWNVFSQWSLLFFCLWLFGFGIQTSLSEVFRVIQGTTSQVFVAGFWRIA